MDIVFSLLIPLSFLHAFQKLESHGSDDPQRFSVNTEETDEIKRVIK